MTHSDRLQSTYPSFQQKSVAPEDEKILRIYVTYDVDPDGANLNGERTKLSWRGLESIPVFAAVLASHGVRQTFFLRVDDQIRTAYGDALALYHRHLPIWDALRDKGHELAWHPHLYAWDACNGQFVPQQHPEACAAQLLRAWESIRSAQLPVVSVRLGEAWHSAATMALLDELGLRVDSTAVPGRTRKDARRSFDWAPTPNRPYHPSRRDHRRPGPDPLSILEVPMTSAPVQAPYDAAPVRRYLNPLYRREILEAWLTAYFDEWRAGSAGDDLVVIFHPDETIDQPPNDLMAFGVAALDANFAYLRRRIESEGLGIRYCLLKDAAPC